MDRFNEEKKLLRLLVAKIAKGHLQKLLCQKILSGKIKE